MPAQVATVTRLSLGGDMRRRETILLGATATWPLAACAAPAMPVVGYLSATSRDDGRERAAAFHRGLQESGYIVGQNVAIEYHWAEQQNKDRLPAMAADLVKRHVTVIAATTTPAALAAQAATTTIPIVFEVGSDPVPAWPPLPT